VVCYLLAIVVPWPDTELGTSESGYEEGLSMFTATLAAVLALGSADAFRPQAKSLVIHVTHHAGNVNAARLADALREACIAPAMNCRVARQSEATTFLYVTADRHEIPVRSRPVPAPEAWRLEDPPAPRQLIAGFVDITSQVMLPGSVSGRDESLERLGATLLAAVKDRLAERTGVLVIGPTDAR